MILFESGALLSRIGSEIRDLEFKMEPNASQTGLIDSEPFEGKPGNGRKIPKNKDLRWY